MSAWPDPPPLSPTIAALAAPGDLRRVLPRVRGTGIRSIHLDGTVPGLRPRDLDASARRDLRTMIRRAEIGCSGIDALIPPTHFDDPAFADRAHHAVAAIIDLAADLAGAGVLPIVHTEFPNESSSIAGAVARDLAEHGRSRGVILADLSGEADHQPGIAPGCLVDSIEDADTLISRGGSAHLRITPDVVMNSQFRGGILQACTTMASDRPDAPVILDLRHHDGPLDTVVTVIDRWRAFSRAGDLL